MHSHNDRNGQSAGSLLLRYSNYARRHGDFAFCHHFWPPCCTWLQFVRQYYTERCTVLDITAVAIARYHLHHVPLHTSQWRQTRPLNGILSRGAHRLGIGNCITCVVIDSSLTRGLSTELNTNGVDSIGFVYPGSTIPRLRRQINQIGLSKTEQVVVLCGGNDLDTMSPATVVKNYDAMIHDIKRHAPSATIHVINIPPRGENPDILTGKKNQHIS